MQAEIIKNDSGKFYQYQDYLLPSVNTIIEQTRLAKERKALDNWQATQTEEQQNAVRERGSAIHLLIQRFFETGELPIDPCLTTYGTEDPVDYWLAAYNTLSLNHTKTLELANGIKGIELPVVNLDLKYAGTIDWIGYWNRKLTLIDFKTSAKLKQRNWLKENRLQLAAYKLAIWEQYGIEVKELAIIVFAKYQIVAQTFTLDEQEQENDCIAWKARVAKFYRQQG